MKFGDYMVILHDCRDVLDQVDTVNGPAIGARLISYLERHGVTGLEMKEAVKWVVRARAREIEGWNYFRRMVGKAKGIDQ